MSSLLVAAGAFAAEPAPAEPEKVKVELSGQWSVWGLSQHNFLFGKDHALDDGSYVVQLLRARADAGKKLYGVVAQVDAAQGWWGVDNSPNQAPISAVDPATGAPLSVPTYNVDGLFSNKDTNYAIHLDTAYGWFAIGPLRAQVGRQPWTYGHRLVLDEDLDSVVLSAKPAKPVTLQLSWAKVAEGKGAYTTPSGALMSDTYEGTGDVNLFGARARLELPAEKGGKVEPASFHRAELFGLYYLDGIAGTIEDPAVAWTHLPSGLGAAESRFSPNVTNLLAVGLSGEGRDGVLGYKGEVDVLSGRDGVDNADFALGQLDRNSGALFGWNAYAEGTAYTNPIVPLDLGLVGGVGSGDPDVTGGRGNVNKISTQGFFPLLNVWEDSVMPDVQGISPQGLGSPVSRGYRELENTLVGIAKVGVVPVQRLRLEGAFAYLQATQPVRGFDETGTPVGPASRDLGWEVDANGSFAFHDNVGLKLLWGWFQPGDAAMYVINGNTDTTDAAWELKTEFGVKL
jgi:hypothetical protein